MMRRLAALLTLLMCLWTAVAMGAALAEDLPENPSQTEAPAPETEAPAEESPLQFDVQELVIGRGKSAKITAEYDTETYGKGAKLVWSTSDQKVARVSGGNVSGAGVGTAVITCTATFKDGTTAENTCRVEVYQPVSAFSAKKTSITVLVEGEAVAPEMNLRPEDASYTDITWVSADPGVATVDEQGRISGVAGGRTTVTGTLNEPGVQPKQQKSVRIQVTVNQGVKRVDLDQTSITVAKGKSEKLAFAVAPETATNKKLNWTSSNPKVATVSGGTVRGVGTGVCTITAEAADGSGAKATCRVRVIQAVTGVRFNKSRVTIFEKDNYDSSLTVQPKDATDKTMTWTSSNPTVAQVNASGRVIALNTGKTTITATAKDGSGKAASYELTVEPACPVTVTNISTYWYYRRDVNCLFVTPYNWCKTLTVKTFNFDVRCYDRNDKLLDYFTCEWSGGGFRSFGPGKYGDSGSWHWYDCYYSLHCYKQTITVTKVTFTDGTTHYIPLSDRRTTTFY